MTSLSNGIWHGTIGVAFVLRVERMAD